MPKLTMMHNNGVDAATVVVGVMAAAAAADPLGSPAAMAVGSCCALAAQGEDGGGSEACFARLASRLAQGKVGRGAVALALLASLGSCSSAFAGCWG